jgi:hypothetical protein
MPLRFQRSFSYTTGARYDLPSLRPFHHELLQFGVFIVIEIKSAQALENGGLVEREHGARLRPWRSHVN